MIQIRALDRKNRGTAPSHPPVIQAIAGCLFLLLPVWLSACARLGPPPPETIEVAILDFSTPPELGREPLKVKGWWFGTRTIHENRRAGIMFANALANALRRLDYIAPRPRTELKTYFLEKRKMLTSRFPGFSQQEYDEMLGKMTPLDYGVDLGVDQVISGEILECNTVFYYVSFLWSSRVRVRVDLWDVRSQERKWSRVFYKKKTCLSQTGTMLLLTRHIAAELEKTYYRAPAK